MVTVFPRRGFTFVSNNSSGLIAEDITIHAGGNMGFVESTGLGGNVYRYDLTALFYFILLRVLGRKRIYPTSM
jgi:hypothetical protein